jgi:nucleoside-diphosphate-sugar epimerase
MTGASGPKSGAIVARELGLQHQVIGLDLQPPVAGASTTGHQIADIRNIQDWRPRLEGVDAVVHFAALHAPHRETHSRADFVATNVDATARLIEAAKQSGVKRFLLASTTSVYGRSMRLKTRAAWVTEALLPDAEDIYDETKLAAEALCRDAFSPAFVTTAIRFSRAFPEPLPLMALYRLYRGVDARDVAQAFARALITTMSSFETFNVSGETPFLEHDCDALMADAPAVLRQRCLGLVDAFEARGWSLPTSIDRVYVIEKAKRELGYTPRWRVCCPPSKLLKGRTFPEVFA